MASTYLTRTSGTATSTQKFTVSAWVKQCLNPTGATDQAIWGVGSSNTNLTYLRLRSANNSLQFYMEAGGSEISNYVTNRLFRDVSAWYHIVLAVDTTQTTAANRVKIYVNGVQETSFSSSVVPSVNHSVVYLSSNLVNIGRRPHANNNYFDGLISHINFIDGTAYPASTFGSTDSTTGEWEINTAPSVTYGNNGFFILKDGNSVTDQSGEGNNFTVGGGTLTKTEDCPSNVFCTINPLNSYWAAGTFTYGNNAVVLPNKSGAWNTGTLGMTSGKYYWEIKCTGSSNGAELQLGIADKSPKGNTGSGVAGTAFGINSNGEYGIYAYNGAFIGNGVANPYTSWGSATTNGIAMIAVDLDNNKFYGGVNGTWFASGNPATGANGKTIQAVANTVDGCYYPAVGTFQGYDGKVECNFGNGYFADNAVSSAGSNASGNGIFEYDVPTGFTALSTKGLNL